MLEEVCSAGGSVYVSKVVDMMFRSERVGYEIRGVSSDVGAVSIDVVVVFSSPVAEAALELEISSAMQPTPMSNAVACSTVQPAKRWAPSPRTPYSAEMLTIVPLTIPLKLWDMLSAVSRALSPMRHGLLRLLVQTNLLAWLIVPRGKRGQLLQLPVVRLVQ